MLDRYPTEPYRFIPPHRSAFWSWVSKHVVPVRLKKTGVLRWQFSNQELLCESVRKGAGVMLAPNHSRWADPMVVGLLASGVKHYLYYLASYHLFRQSKVMGWFMNRIGGYSIWREGTDRESIRATVRILAEGDRPVVLFPEGTWFRQNDRVGPLQDGLSLIARQAAKQSERPVLIHPVGVKYWLLQDPRPELARRLADRERKLGWHPQGHLDLVPRIEKLGGAMLGLKEVEHFGEAQPGTLDERIARLVHSHVTDLEKRHLSKEHDGWPLERIRRLRQVLVRKLVEAKDSDGAAEALRALGDLLFCENVSSHSQDYLHQSPTLERLTETVQRMEETLSDAIEVAVAPMGVTATVGPALDVREFAASGRGAGKGPDPLVAQLRGAIQEQVDKLIAQGPPAEWGCPKQPTTLSLNGQPA